MHYCTICTRSSPDAVQFCKEDLKHGMPRWIGHAKLSWGSSDGTAMHGRGVELLCCTHRAVRRPCGRDKSPGHLCWLLRVEPFVVVVPNATPTHSLATELVYLTGYLACVVLCMCSRFLFLAGRHVRVAAALAPLVLELAIEDLGATLAREAGLFERKLTHLLVVATG